MMTINQDTVGRTDIISSSPFTGPRGLLYYRLFGAAWLWIQFIVRLATFPVGEYLRFLTTLSWFGIALYFAYALTLSYAFQRSQFILKGNSLGSLVFDYLHRTCHFLSWWVSLVFWSTMSNLITESQGVERWVHVNHHVAGLVLMIGDCLLSRIPLPMTGLGLALSPLPLYLCLTYLLHYSSLNLDWPYPFVGDLLDIKQNPVSTFVYICVALIVGFLIYMFPYSLHVIRDRYCLPDETQLPLSHSKPIDPLE